MNTISKFKLNRIWQPIRGTHAAVENIAQEKQNHQYGAKHSSGHEIEDTKTSAEPRSRSQKFVNKSKHVSANEHANTETQNSKFGHLTHYRITHPEFVPYHDPKYRNLVREKLERMDMMARRSQIMIPEFYVGSILAVEYSEPHSPTKMNRFVGICILRSNTGLPASFILRNVVDGHGVEVKYALYDPTIQSIQCLKLEKRLDHHLIYLRDAPPEYSTFPFDMEPVYLREGDPVPVNPIQVPLKSPPWYAKWEREDLKGVQNLMPLLSEGRKQKINRGKKPWEKYDLMKAYRSTIPEEEQVDIYKELDDGLQKMEKEMRKRRKIISQ